MTTHKITELTLVQAQQLIGREIRTYWRSYNPDTSALAQASGHGGYMSVERATAHADGVLLADSVRSWALPAAGDYVTIDGDLPWEIAPSPTTAERVAAAESALESAKAALAAEQEEIAERAACEGLPDGWRWSGVLDAHASGVSVNAAFCDVNEREPVYISDPRVGIVRVSFDALAAVVDRVRAARKVLAADTEQERVLDTLT